jgi:hypothetical protein
MENIMDFDYGLYMGMQTNNSLGSGLDAYNKRGPFQIQILPKWVSTNGTIHPHLQRVDAETFVIVFMAGQTLYMNGQVSDPFFSANTPSPGGSGSYVADWEATALGCLQQIQICVTLKSGQICYPWSKGFYSKRVVDDLVSSGDEDTLRDYVEVLPYLVRFASLPDYLQKRSGTPASLLMARLRLGSFGFVHSINTTQQWIAEVEAWFTKTMYWLRFGVLTIAINEIDPRNNDLAPAQSPVEKNSSLCDMVLLIDSDYTNINFIGFCAILVSVVVVWLVSYINRIGLCLITAFLVVVGLVSYIIQQIEWVAGKISDLLDDAKKRLQPYSERAWKGIYGVWEGIHCVWEGIHRVYRKMFIDVKLSVNVSIELMRRGDSYTR